MSVKPVTVTNPVWAAPEAFWLERPFDSDWQASRTTAWSEAQKVGLPGRKTEDYRYLNLKALREGAWKVSETLKLSGDQQNAIRERIRENVVAGSALIVVVDGTFRAEFSQTKDLLPNDFNQVAKQAWIAGLDWKDKIIADFGLNAVPMDYFDYLNQSFFGRGFALAIAKETSAKIQILSITSDSSAWSPFQIWLDVATRSNVEVIETHVSLNPVGERGKVSWSQPNFWVRIQESASVTWIQNQKMNAVDMYLGRCRFALGKASKLEALNIGIGASLARQNLDVHVFGEGAFAQLNGLSLVGPGQVVDFHTLIDHQAGGSTTEQLYKGILGSDSQAVFNGKVIIRHGAQKASSSQLNQNLMLSDRAEIDSKPELEIFADDVKATHGSAVGQLNADEVFYLQSRAITEEAAKEMLALGSVVGLLENISNADLKSKLEEDLRQTYRRISQELM